MPLGMNISDTGRNNLLENNYSLSFDDDGDYLTIDTVGVDGTVPDAFTSRLNINKASFMFWIKPANVNTVQPLFSVGASESNQFTIMLDANGKVNVKLVNTSHITSYTCVANQWTYIVVRYDGTGTPNLEVVTGTQGTLGEKAFSTTGTIPAIIPNFGDVDMLIGKICAGLTLEAEHYNGLINNVFMMYDYLEDEEIEYLYNTYIGYIQSPFKDDLINNYTVGYKCHWWWGMGDGYEQGSGTTILNSGSMFTPWTSIENASFYQMPMVGNPTIVSRFDDAANVPSASD